jgi:hypothetical protein
VAQLVLEEFPFDQYQRYRIVQEIVNAIRRRLDCPRLHVLDVGGFFRTITGEDILPIAEFLPDDDTVAIDMTQGKLTSYVRGSGASLPFANGSFDVITTCDTLEHVPPVARPAFIKELLRVTSRYVVLAAPFDDERTRLAEQIIFDYDKTFYGFEQPQLKEHAENGLPDRDEVRGWLNQGGFLYVDFASGYLHHWLPMMLLKHWLFGFPEATRLHVKLDRYYNLNFYHLDHRTPAYRHVFLASKAKEDADLLAQLAQAFQPQPGSQPDDGMAFARSLLTLIEWEREWRRERERSTIESLQAELMRSRQENERLLRYIEDIRSGRVMRLLDGLQRIASALKGAKKQS